MTGRVIGPAQGFMHGIFIGSKKYNKIAFCSHLWSPAHPIHQLHQKSSHVLNVSLPVGSFAILANGRCVPTSLTFAYVNLQRYKKIHGLKNNFGGL